MVYIATSEETGLQVTWKRGSEWTEVTRCGRAFHARGPATGKAR